jgi:hypothetical protein
MRQHAAWFKVGSRGTRSFFLIQYVIKFSLKIICTGTYVCTKIKFTIVYKLKRNTFHFLVKTLKLMIVVYYSTSQEKRRSPV